ncbi:hypothetical protein D3C78_1643030 [compost metagenome]
MSRERLAADARAAGQAAKHNLKFIRKYPEKVTDESKLPEMEAYLQMLIRFEAYEFEQEIKNARRAGRTSLRTRLKNLVVSIIAHSDRQVSAK